MDEREFDDREFGEEYKRMFDGIRASDELRRRIAELPNKARRRRTHDLRPYIAAAGAAAATAISQAAMAVYVIVYTVRKCRHPVSGGKDSLLLCV